MRRLIPAPRPDSSVAGLGLRRGLFDEIDALGPEALDFLELAPENWIGVGGRLHRRLEAVAQRYPLLLHGLSLNIGGQAPLDLELVGAIKAFMRRYECPVYSEHLTYCADDGHLYDLLPIPFTTEAVHHVAARVRRVQEELGQRIALENASYYATPAGEMSELEFIHAVVSEADCELLLDVNNIYVNAINHRYDPLQFLHGLPLERVRYIHIAGHYEEAPDLRVDTHGSAVVDPVWGLLSAAYARCGPLPTLLERDFNFPPASELRAELDEVRQRQRAAVGAESAPPAMAGQAGGGRP